MEIIYDFSLPCSCISYTQKIDICLIVDALSEEKRETIDILPLKIPKKTQNIFKEENIKKYIFMKTDT